MMTPIKHQPNESVDERRPAKILIVDDDRDVLDSLRDIIELETASEVEVAADIFSARQIADEFKPDLVLLDVQLGNTIGLSLIPPLKVRNPNAICIVMTAYRDAEYAATAVRNGADDYLFKPLDPDNLLSLIDRHLVNQGLIISRQETERRLNAIFQQTYQILLMIDVDGRVSEANNTALEFGGWTMVDIKGKLLFDLPCIGAQDARSLMRSLLVRVQQGEIVQQKVELHGRVGSSIIEITMKPVLDKYNEVMFIVFEGHDVTERDAAEAEVRQLNEALEARVKERTIELEQAITLLEDENKHRMAAESLLVLAKEDAERANELKSEFLSRISHELRTPMNAIMGFGQLLEQEEMSEDQAESTSEIMRASRHLLALIDEVFELVSIDTDRANIHVDDFDIMPLLEDCIDSIYQFINEKGIFVSVGQSDCEQVLVKADSDKVKKIIVNLLTNAVKYNKENGEIILGCDCKDSSRGFIRIEVTDTGIGLTQEQQNIIFEPFARVGQEYSDIKGSGVGLTTCRKLIEAMGGQMGVKSQEGKGSTFWIELPVGKQVVS